ncbi:Inner membrane protein YhaI [Starkeya nomas]|uniref:Inner membrane protein YhaI n=2 Tax=Xanthobacteraceae TaxID=335928 RepID=A0A5S9NXL6_9HYPH|nr:MULTISPECIES: DUF805 domain-containing protein [Xanthobacteraceae]TSJ62797.1 DUF805 domain-containing protein [Ancylobacter moscoviensis]CAA0095395.1 Inner membrane protein YhaI [Starkeya nomas]
MSITESISSVLGKYATFAGRAPRSEYWWWAVFLVIVNWVTGLIDFAIFGEYAIYQYGDARLFTPITTLVGLALTIPTLAVAARRFHDMDRTGWWLLIGLTGIGGLVIFFWFMFKGTEGPNRFGPDPLAT